MFLNFRVQSIITFFFYLILIGVSIISLNNLMEERTAFDEAFIGNEARFPSFTLCPMDYYYGSKSIKSFEDVHSRRNRKCQNEFKVKYHEFKPYEEAKIVDKTYNQILNNNWYFAPKIVHCGKKIGDLLIVSQQIQIICISLGIKISQFVEH